MSRWQSGPGIHLRLVQMSNHLVSCLLKESMLAVVFLMLLLYWDLYACPQTLAIASACLRSSTLVRTLVFLCWYQLSFHSLALRHLTMEDENRKKQLTAKILRTRWLLWLLWCVLTLVLSTVAILYQVSQSIPSFLPVGKIWLLVLKACVGVIQGMVGDFLSGLHCTAIGDAIAAIPLCNVISSRRHLACNTPPKEEERVREAILASIARHSNTLEELKRREYCDSVQTRGIVKTSGSTRDSCRNRYFYTKI